MKTKTLAVFITIMSIAIIPGCKKDNLPDKAYQEQRSPYQELKTWFESETNSAAKKDIRTGTPVWQRTKYYPESQTYITPILLSDKNKAVYKFLVTTGNPKGGVTQGNYIYLFPDKNNTMDISNIDQNLLPDLFLLKQIPAGFSGTIIKYDLDYNPVFTKSLEKGKMTDATKKMVTGQPGAYRDMNDITPNSAGLACGQCISYYLVTYDAWGNIINVEYLYTECGDCEEEEEGGGGNGGGNNVMPCEMTEAQMEIALNSITAISNNGSLCQLGTPSAPDQNGIIRAPKSCRGGGCTVTIMTGYSPQWTSSYGGVVYKINPNDPWKWESCNYAGFHHTAGVIPPCVQATATAYAPALVISEDHSKVLTSGLYTWYVTWQCLTATGVETKSGAFNATLYANMLCD